MRPFSIRSFSPRIPLIGLILAQRNRWATRNIAAIAVCLMICLAGGSAAIAQTVAPPGDTTTEPDPGGVFSNRIPFATSTTYGDTSTRYQQVYDATDFSGPVMITQISFRAAPGSSPFSITDSDITLDMSTTSAGADALSSTFADNIGADDTTVFSGSLTLTSTASGPVGGPNPFDITITLSTPFEYDPSAGNLLLDVENFAPSTSDGSVFFDADGTLGDDTSSVLAFDESSTTADISDTVGLVTQFTTTPIGGNTGNGGNGGNGGGAAAPLPPAIVLFPLIALLAGFAARRLRVFA